MNKNDNKELFDFINKELETKGECELVFNFYEAENFNLDTRLKIIKEKVSFRDYDFEHVIENNEVVTIVKSKIDHEYKKAQISDKKMRVFLNDEEILRNY